MQNDMSQLRGAIFALEGVSDEDRKAYASHPHITDAGRSLLATVFDLAEKRDDHRTDIHLVAEQLGIRPPGVRKRAEELVNLAILSKTTIRLGTVRSSTCYVVSKAPATLPQPTSSLRSPADQMSLFKGELEMLEDYVTQPPILDDFFCSLLYGAMRYGRRDQRQMIDVQIRWGKEPVRVVSTADSETGVAFVRDLRFVIAILTIAKQIITERELAGEKVRNRFLIRTIDLLEFVRLSNTGGNRRTVLGALRRLEGTKFTFQNPISQALRAKFGDDIWTEQGFRFITELGIVGRRSPEEGKVPEVFSVSLSQMIYERMIDSQVISTFLASPTLLVESNDAALAIGLWCRRVVRHGEGNQLFELNHFVRSVVPQLGLAKARRLITDLFEQRRIVVTQAEGNEEDGEKPVGVTILIHGYLVTLHSKHVHVRPDPDDPVVGLASPYRKILERRRKLESTD